jgi:hypothetical protein
MDGEGCGPSCRAQRLKHDAGYLNLDTPDTERGLRCKIATEPSKIPTMLRSWQKVHLQNPLWPYHFVLGRWWDGRMLYRLSLPVMLLAGTLASAAKGADISAPPVPPDPSGWIVTIGGDGRAVPLYMGSDA